MSTDQKDFLTRWAPYIIMAITYAVSFGIFFQRSSSEWERNRERDIQLRADMMPLPDRIKFFGTRSENELAAKAVEQRLLAIETLLRDSNVKVDLLYRREIETPRR